MTPTSTPLASKRLRPYGLDLDKATAVEMRYQHHHLDPKDLELVPLKTVKRMIVSYDLCVFPQAVVDLGLPVLPAALPGQPGEGPALLRQGRPRVGAVQQQAGDRQVSILPYRQHLP